MLYKLVARIKLSLFFIATDWKTMEPKMTEIDNLLRIEAVMASTGLAKSTLYEMQRTGEFPQSLALSRRCVAWRASEINSWIASRVRSTND